MGMLRQVARYMSEAVGLGLLATKAAHAAAPMPAADCPPEEWICDAPPVSPPPPVPPPAPEFAVAPPTPELPENPAALLLDEEKGNEAPPEVASPWSINLRGEGILLGSRQNGEVGLGGVGASLRYVLNPIVTLDLGLDSFLGKDYEDHPRAESSLSISSLLYLNPERAVRPYALFGISTSIAQVDLEGGRETWTYFGAHAGLGLDVRLDPRFALNFDLVGFMRQRTDAQASREPEFTDHGKQTNTSAGGVFRAGVTLHW
jgi:hypothetical protein